jgi:hypothetical protein
MGKLNSFRDVAEDLFYNEMFEELSSHIEDSPSEIEYIYYEPKHQAQLCLHVVVCSHFKKWGEISYGR